MKKKMICFVILISSCLLFTGCTQLTPLSEEETNMVAEYIAMLMLKYDANYENKLTTTIEIKDNPSYTNEEFADLTDEINGKEENQEEDATKEEPADDNTSQAGNESTVTGPAKEWESGESTDINSILGNENFTVRYKEANEYQSYPDNKTDNYFTLEATEGKKLVVVSFSIVNVSGGEARYQMTDPNIYFRLDVKGENFVKPSMTLLTNDIQYIDVTLENKKAAEGVAVFSVDKDVDIREANILVYTDSKTAIEKLR